MTTIREATITRLPSPLTKPADSSVQAPIPVYPTISPVSIATASPEPNNSPLDFLASLLPDLSYTRNLSLPASVVTRPSPVRVMRISPVQPADVRPIVSLPRPTRVVTPPVPSAPTLAPVPPTPPMRLLHFSGTNIAHTLTIPHMCNEIRVTALFGHYFPLSEPEAMFLARHLDCISEALCFVGNEMSGELLDAETHVGVGNCTYFRALVDRCRSGNRGVDWLAVIRRTPGAM